LIILGFVWKFGGDRKRGLENKKRKKEVEIT